MSDTNKKKILVTGGAGFIGSHVVDGLLAAGHLVTIIDDLSTGRRDYLPPAAVFHELDIRSDEASTLIRTGGFDALYHLAAQVDLRRSVAEPELDNAINLLGSRRIFAAAAAGGVKRIVFTSTGGAIYGDCDRPARETDLPLPTSPYAIHKYAAERYLELMRDQSGISYAVLRLANVYGPRQYKGGECGVIGILTFNQRSGETSRQNGDGSKTRDFVYVGDVARAHLLALESGSGVYNIGTGRETSIRAVVAAIEAASGRPLNLEIGPDMPGEVRRSVLDAGRAQAELGWASEVGLEEGIAKTLAWEDD